MLESRRMECPIRHSKASTLIGGNRPESAAGDVFLKQPYTYAIRIVNVQ
jgi:hypothetical protein